MDRDDFREAMARWASGVSVIACRHDGVPVATTVSALLSLSLDPPAILLALGPNATVLPFLKPGAEFGVSVLSAAQRRLAAVFADPLPVGAPAFTDGTPVLPEALLGLHCTVREARTAADHTIVIAGVRDAIVSGAPEGPLIRYGRRYHALFTS